MKACKFWICSVLVLCLSFSISAQQRPHSTENLYAELQKLRKEVTQLRDMLEIQTYELEKIKAQKNEQVPLNQAIPAAQAPIVNSIGSNTQSQEIQSQQEIDISADAVQDIDFTQPQEPTDTITLPQQSGVNESQPGTLQSANASQDKMVEERIISAPPLPLTNNIALPAEAIVEERVISTSPLGDPRQSDSAPIEQLDIEVDSDRVNNAIEENFEGTDSETTTISAPIQNAADTTVTQVVPVVVQEEPLVNAPLREKNIDVVAALVPETDNISASNNVITAPLMESTNTKKDQAIVATQFSEQALYQKGFELLSKSQYNDAVNVFLEQLDDYPDGDFSDDAYYWIGESKYVNRQLTEAKQSFTVILKKYPNSPRLPDAMLKVAYIEQEQGNADKAKQFLLTIIQQHPRSDAAISAKNRIENFQ